MRIMFLDESGDHNLNLLDPFYPVFVLAGCILTQEEHDKKLSPAVEKFKHEMFKNDKIILHYVDYTRNKNGFEQMAEKLFREKEMNDPK